MNETEFYAVIKLVSGEEIFSLIDVDLEPEDPIIIPGGFFSEIDRLTLETAGR